MEQLKFYSKNRYTPVLINHKISNSYYDFFTSNLNNKMLYKTALKFTNYRSRDSKIKLNPLIYTIKNNLDCKSNYILEYGNNYDSGGYHTLFYLSLYENLFEVVLKSIKYLDLDAKNSSRIPFNLIQRGSVENLKLFYDKTSTPVDLRIEGITPLMYASSLGRKKHVECLLNKGASVNSVDVNGFNSAFFASCNGHIRILSCLYNTQIDCIEKRDVHGSSPLDWAIVFESNSCISFLKRLNCSKNKLPDLTDLRCKNIHDFNKLYEDCSTNISGYKYIMHGVKSKNILNNIFN